MNVIIGAGLSGLTTAHHIGGDCVILEKSDQIGGLSTQYFSNGYWLDYGGHYFHFQNRLAVLKIVRKFINLLEYQRNSKVYLHRRFVPYPLQYHLSYLSSSIGKEVLNDLGTGFSREITSLENFLEAHFGKTLTNLFFSPFLTKYYQTELKDLSVGMEKGSIPIPSPQDIGRGIRGERFSRLGYNPEFYYPKDGLLPFIQSYSSPVSNHIKKNEEVVKIDYKNKIVITGSKSWNYQNLISTMPLNRLLDILIPADHSLFPRSEDLCHVSTIVTNVVLRIRRRRFHWVYLPEKKFPFYRMGYYPRSNSTICYLERNGIWEEDGVPEIPRDDVILTLKELGAIKSKDEILHIDSKVIPVSYVIFDHNWSRIVPPALKKLGKLDIHSIGRYGGWTYSSMVEDVESAIMIAKGLSSD